MGKLAINGGEATWPYGFELWPIYDEREEKALLEVLHSRNWGGYPSPNVKAREFASAFAKAHDAAHGICCTNGSISIQVALKAGGIKYGDEVITTPYTFAATAEAALWAGAVPVFVDVHPDTYCLDAALVEHAITPRTRAVIPVHLGHSMADMDAIMEIAGRRKLLVIEDCAHMHGAKWRGKGAGSIGDFGSFSFQSSKLMTAGEGGIILTSNRDFMQRCQSLVNCGRKEPGYNEFEGSHIGYNFRMTEFQCAILQVQLERLEEQTLLRERNATALTRRLKEIPGIRPLVRDPRVTRLGCYEYIFRYGPEGFGGLHRDRFVKALSAEGVPASGDFYVPLYRNKTFPLRAADYPQARERYGEVLAPDAVRCPVAEKAAYEEAVWLWHPLLMKGEEEIEAIVRAIVKIRENVKELL